MELLVDVLNMVPRINSNDSNDSIYSINSSINNVNSIVRTCNIHVIPYGDVLLSLALSSRHERAGWAIISWAGQFSKRGNRSINPRHT